MQKTILAALGAAALLALSGTAANAQDATPICSKTVTDNCLQREGHAAAPHHVVAKRHAAPKHRVAASHRAPARHRVAAKHPVAPKRKVAAKAVPAHKM